MTIFEVSSLIVGRGVVVCRRRIVDVWEEGKSMTDLTSHRNGSSVIRRATFVFWLEVRQ